LKKKTRGARVMGRPGARLGGGKKGSKDFWWGGESKKKKKKKKKITPPKERCRKTPKSEGDGRKTRSDRYRKFVVRVVLDRGEEQAVPSFRSPWAGGGSTETRFLKREGRELVMHVQGRIQTQGEQLSYDHQKVKETTRGV